MRTPKPPWGPRRRPATLSDAGWLRESPANHFAHLDIRSRSALRKCMLLPAPPSAAAFPISSAAIAPSQRRPDPSVTQPVAAPRRRDPLRDARIFPVIAEEEILAMRRARLAARAAEPVSAPPAPRERWYESPLALGGLLIAAPPIGLSVLWTSDRYSREARAALTLMTGLTMCLGAAALFVLVFFLSR